MAGLIPQSFIDDLLDRIDIVEVVDRRVKLKKSGKNYMACCPFHQEKTPSFSVNPEKQFYYCFGCGAGGNALGFLMDYENLDFPAAVENLAESAGLQVPREEREDPRARGRRDLYALLEEAARYYKLQLRQHPDRGAAVDYLKGRGLTGTIARDFDIGFAPAGWDNLIRALGNSEEQRRQLLAAGMLIENEQGRIYDRFRHRIMFPIRDMRGRIIGFGGRVLGDDRPKYLNSPETPVFHKGRELYGLYQARRANRQLERVLVTEGYMDVIALAQHGIGYATATLGTATSPAHLEKIYRLCPEAVFCFDGDEAGRQAAARALDAVLPAMQDGRSARFLFLPEGEDPDTLVRDRGPEHFVECVRTAQPLEQFLFEHLAADLDMATREGRARLANLARPYLEKLPAGVYRELMLEALAERTGLAADKLGALMQQQPAGAGDRPPAPPPPDQPPPELSGAAPRQRDPLPPRDRERGHNNLAQAAIALLLHEPSAARRFTDVDALRGIDDGDVALLIELLELLHRRPESSTHLLLGHWYGTPEGELLNRLAGQERLIPGEGIEKQFLDTINALKLQPRQRDFERRVDKLRDRDYSEISDREKLEIIQELREKHRRDQERKA